MKTLIFSAILFFMATAMFAQYPVVSDDVSCNTVNGLQVCYTNPVNVGALVISSSSTSTLFTQTTAITRGSFCNNQTGSAVTLTVTDGNNHLVNTAFSIPANSYLSFNDRIGAILTGGIKMSAGTANAVICWFNGKQ